MYDYMVCLVELTTKYVRICIMKKEYHIKKDEIINLFYPTFKMYSNYNMYNLIPDRTWYSILILHTTWT